MTIWLYVDILFVRTDSSVLGTPLGVGEDIYIGANVIGTTSSNNKLNGNVDEIKIYNQKVLDKSSDFWMLKVLAL